MADVAELERALQNPNVKKMLDVIASAEGADYNTLFGGGKFSDYRAHPNVKAGFTETTGNKNETTAAGRYQFLNKTWKGVSQKYGLKDFSPKNQDLAAVALIMGRGALNDVMKGDFNKAIGKLGGEWASLPTSTAPQPKKSWSEIEKMVGAGGRGPDRKSSKIEIDALLKAYDESKAKTAKAQQPKINKISESDLLKAFDAKKEAEPKPASLPDFDAQGVIQQDQPTQQPQQKPDLSVGQKILGAGEAALSAATGAVGGIVGTAGGALYGAGREILSGDFGSQEAAQRIAQTASEGAQALTYEPKSQGGQRVMQRIGEVSEDIGLTSLPPTLGGGLGTAAATLGRASIPTATIAARDIAQSAKPAITQAISSTKTGVQRAAEAVGLREAEQPQMQGANVGAAQVAPETLRQALAQELPVTPDLTLGQITRSPDQLKFEQETAKTELGAPIRERIEQQHEAVNLNLEQFNQMTGAEAADLRSVGIVVDKALQKELQNDKSKVRAAYKAADKSEEAKTPVDLNRRIDFTDEQVGKVTDKSDVQTTSLTEYLNNQVAAESEPILNSAKQLAVKHGIAAIDDNGQLMPLNPTIKQMERFRTDIVTKTDTMKAPDVRQATIIKNLVDAHTEPYEGKMYKQARTLRRNQAKRWESNQIIKDLTQTKKGSEDRRVALEDVVNRVINRGSLDDMRQVKRTLLTSGDEGKQAWKELQGAAIRSIQDAATSGVAPDSQGRQMISPAKLNSQIRALDKDGKLDYLFGQKGAEQLRALNEISKTMFTVPAMTGINYSNTATAIAAMLDLMFSATSGLPAPVASALRMATSHIKDKKIKARVKQALNLNTGAN